MSTQHPDTMTWSGLARHSLGISLLAVTVFLWTASSFLASTIFADDTYSKPYFVTYLTTTMFSSFLVVRLVGRNLRRCAARPGFSAVRGNKKAATGNATLAGTGETEAFLQPADEAVTTVGDESRSQGSSCTSAACAAAPPSALDFRATLRLAVEFCALWFLANFCQAASLEYTSVASATILFSTSPIWTLLYGTWAGVEAWATSKLLAALGSLAGVALIALGDLSGASDEQRGRFPHKRPTEIAVGDLLALASAMLYGVYTIRFKKRAGDETRVDMLLFLGCVGVANALFLWPGFFLLDIIGLEKFEWPPTAFVQKVILVNAFISVISDLSWAYAVVLTTPLVVTVGLSLSIPLSIVGQVLINAQGSTVAHWIGAVVVVAAFIIVNREERADSEAESARQRQD